MAALIDLLQQGEITPNELVSWLDGIHTPGVLEDLEPLKVEFIPVFLNFLRDQTQGLISVCGGVATPNKTPTPARVTKYVSPAKENASFRQRGGNKNTSGRAKTLRFSDAPAKNESNSNSKCEDSHVPDLEAVLRESHQSPITPTNYNISFSMKSNSNNSNNSPKMLQLNNRMKSSTPRSISFSTPKYENSSGGYRGKRHSLEGIGKPEMPRHSEQRLSLGDFIMTPEVKRGNKKKGNSPLMREANYNSSSKGSSQRLEPHKENILDTSDQDAFPPMGSEKQEKRRINPTRITPVATNTKTKLFPAETSRSVFGVPQGAPPPNSPFLATEEGNGSVGGILEEERHLLRIKRRESLTEMSPIGKAASGRESPPLFARQQEPLHFTEPDPHLVTHAEFILPLAQTYTQLILFNMVPNIMVELYYLFQLLTVKAIEDEQQQVLTNNYSNNVNPRDPTSVNHFISIHNCVFFTTKVLLGVVEVLKVLDRGCVRLLAENLRIQWFCPELQMSLTAWCDAPLPPAPRPQPPKSPIGGVSFQTDTDNRKNFPCDSAFHTFRKQRDSFYEVIRAWEENHLAPGWSFTQTLGARIRALLTLRPGPINYTHFARLFQSQLLVMCKPDDDNTHTNPHDTESLSFLTALKKSQPEKFKRLHERLVTPSKLGGPCPKPSFQGAQEFFHDFIVTAGSVMFNQHLKDVLVSQILNMNERELTIEENEEEEGYESMMRSEVRSVLLSMRLLAKFLGFLEFMPYQTSEHLPENVVTTQITLRSVVCPSISITSCLRQSARVGSLVVGVSWVVEYLSMVDSVALHTRHHLTTVCVLIHLARLLTTLRPSVVNSSVSCERCRVVSDVQQHQQQLSPSNTLLLKLLLGWLFDLPNFPHGLYFAHYHETDCDHQEYEETVQVINAHYSQFCIPCLRIHVNRSSSSAPITNTHITATTTATPRKKSSTGFAVTPSKPSSRTSPNKNQAKTPKKGGICDYPPLTTPNKTPSKSMSVTMLDSPSSTPLKSLEEENTESRSLRLDLYNFVDHQLIIICCPFVCELKNMLTDFSLGISSRSSNSFRKITPLSTSDKNSPGQTQRQLQLQLEDNFFHNQPSAVRKTTEFVIERIASNVVKIIRSQIIPQLHKTAIEEVRLMIDGLVIGSPMPLDQSRGAVQKRVIELSADLTSQLKTQSIKLAENHCNQQAQPSLTCLLPHDTPEKGLSMCVHVVRRNVQERVSTWLQSHLTPTLFTKDLNTDADRLIRQAQKAADFQATAHQQSLNEVSTSAGLANLSIGQSGQANLSSISQSTSRISINHSSFNQSDVSNMSLNQSEISTKSFNHSALSNQSLNMSNIILDHSEISLTEGNGPCPVIVPKAALKPQQDTLPISPETHNVEAPSPSRVLTDVKDFASQLMKGANVIDTEVISIIASVRICLSERQDMTMQVYRALETLMVDLATAVAVTNPSAFTKMVCDSFISMWKKVESGGVIPITASGLSSILCPRTIMLLAQREDLAHQSKAWLALQSLLSELLMSEMLTPLLLQESCTALLRHDWPQAVLNGISSCVSGIAETVKKDPKLSTDPSIPQLLEWLAWVTQQMDNFPEHF